MLDSRQRNAIGRAVERGGARLVRRLRFGRYLVPSATRPDRTYTVTVDAQGRYRCTCEAGLMGHPCHHAASVYVAKVEHASRSRVTRPAAT